MSVNIDIGGEGGSPTLTTSRMSVYFTDTGITILHQLLEISPCLDECLITFRSWLRTANPRTENLDFRGSELMQIIMCFGVEFAGPWGIFRISIQFHRRNVQGCHILEFTF